MSKRIRRVVDGVVLTYIYGPQGDLLDIARSDFNPRFGAAVRNLAPSETIQRIARLIERQKGLCFYCEAQLDMREVNPPLMPTVDEVTPRRAGGRKRIDNQVAACWRCNNIKGGRLPTTEELRRLEALNAATPPKPISALVAEILDEIDGMEE